MINGQPSSWTNVNARVPQRSILGPLLFLIYINDLSDGLSSNAKLFANDTSLFSVVHDINASAIELNSDLKKSMIGPFNGKWFSIQIAASKLKKLYSAKKIKKATHAPLLFNSNNVSQVVRNVSQVSSQKHLEIILDVKLTFEENLINVFNKTSKT